VRRLLRHFSLKRPEPERGIETMPLEVVEYGIS